MQECESEGSFRSAWPTQTAQRELTIKPARGYNRDNKPGNKTTREAKQESIDEKQIRTCLQRHLDQFPAYDQHSPPESMEGEGTAACKKPEWRGQCVPDDCIPGQGRNLTFTSQHSDYARIKKNSEYTGCGTERYSKGRNLSNRLGEVIIPGSCRNKNRCDCPNCGD